VNSVQFAFALIGGMGTFLGAAWIISQAIQKTASNPVYDERFTQGRERMAQLDGEIKALARKVDDLPDRIISNLRAMGVLKNKEG